MRMRKSEIAHAPPIMYLRPSPTLQSAWSRRGSEMALRTWKQLVYACQNLTFTAQRVATSIGKTARTCESWRSILNEAHHGHMCRCHHVSATATRLSGYRVRAVHSSSESEVSYIKTLSHVQHHRLYWACVSYCDHAYMCMCISHVPVSLDLCIDRSW